MHRQQTPNNLHTIETINEGLDLLAKIIARDVYAQSQEGCRKDGADNGKS